MVFQRSAPLWEPPELTLSSLHEEMLLLVSAENKQMHHAAQLLRTTLDPPEEAFVEAAQVRLHIV